MNTCTLVFLYLFRLACFLALGVLSQCVKDRAIPMRFYCSEHASSVALPAPLSQIVQDGTLLPRNSAADASLAAASRCAIRSEIVGTETLELAATDFRAVEATCDLPLRRSACGRCTREKGVRAATSARASARAERSTATVSQTPAAQVK
jgi:hypothetical protein